MRSFENSPKKWLFPFLAGLITLCSTLAHGATTIYVPNQYDTIQDAIDAAVNGDTVVVRNGTYLLSAPLTFDGKGITVKSSNGPGNCILDGQKNTRVVTFDRYEGSDSVLSGFTIQNGKAENGGGIYCEGSSPTINHCIIRGNLATSAKGGGIYCISSSPIIKYSSIVDNNAIGPSDGYGGGIYCKSSSPKITHCRIAGNYAEGSGGCSLSGAWAGYSFGGGIYIDGGSSPMIKYSTLESNGAYGGGCGPSRGTPLSYGGGIYSRSSSPTLYSCTITNNSSTASDRNGGGAYFFQSSASIVNTIISSNSAKNGAGMYFRESSSWLTNCTITKNVAAINGGALFALDSYPEIVNTILWANKPQEIYQSGTGIPVVSYSCVSGGYDGAGNIDKYPDFLNISTKNFHLKPTSPCIDAGDNTTPELPSKDRDDNPRIVGDRVDMGAYEYRPPTITLISPNGGQVWEVGKTKNILWKSTGAIGSVKIQISRDGGTTWTTIIGSTANDGVHRWKVTGLASNQCKVRVRSATDATVADISNGAFSIQ